MAKYTITHTCGHQQDHDITGAIAGRAGRRDWLATTECNVCRTAARRAAETAATEQAAAAHALPALDGSVKQVDWADKIRASKISTLAATTMQVLQAGMMSRPVVDQAVAVIGPRLMTEQTPEARLAKLQAMLVAAIATRTSAKWWIDNRDLTDLDILVLAITGAAV